MDAFIPEDERTPYGYTPTRWICGVFITLFGLSTLLHVFQAFKLRTRWTLPTLAAGGLTEVIGWSGRLWSSINPPLLDPFLMQITTTIIAPTFMAAGNFTVLGYLIRQLGPKYSRISPRWYLIIFITLDLASLVVQAVGGAQASMAARTNEDAEPGGRIMLWGIVTQMIAMTLYVACASEFLLRVYYDRPVKPTATPAGSEDNLKSPGSRLPRKIQFLLFAMILTTVFLYIRAIYRTIELIDGWTGRIISTQLYFNVLDGMPIVLVMITWNILHPGLLLRGNKPTKVESDKEVQ